MTRRPTSPAPRRPAPPARGATDGAAPRPVRGGGPAPVPARRDPPARPVPPRISSAQQRIEARLRRQRWRRIALGAGGLVAVAGLVWVVLGSPWLRVQRVDVEGVERLDPAVVVAAGQSQVGRPMVMASTDQVAARLRGRPLVLAVEVRRSWPSTLTVVVTERRPAAAVASAGRFTLVDRGGVVVAVEARPPAGVPVVEVDLGKADSGTVGATVDVLGSLPADVRAQVRRVGASTPDDVWFVLANGATVRWGGADQAELKAEVLRQLKPGPAGIYDVSAPGTPAVSQATTTRRRAPSSPSKRAAATTRASTKGSAKPSSTARPPTSPAPSKSGAAPTGTSPRRTTRG